MKPVYIIEGMNGEYYNKYYSYTEASNERERLLAQGHKVRIVSDYES